jgi:hypothetical protein
MGATIAQGTESIVQAPATAAQPAGMAAQAHATTTQVAATIPQPPARAGRRRLAAYRADASIAQRLLMAQIAIEAVLGDAMLQAALAAHGYDRARLLQGQALRDQATALVQQRRAHLGDQIAATDTRDGARAQAHAIYMRHVAIARVALRAERGPTHKLDLSARKRTHAGWLMQAQQFYASATGDDAILSRMAAYGVTREQLAAAQAQVAAVARSIVAQQGRKGVAQETTRARDAALRALDGWMRDFMAIARVALASQPEALERLGVVVARP